MSREYYKNIENLYKLNEVVNLEEVFEKLYIPEGFEKELDTTEKMRLLNDQLSEQGLMCDSLIQDGCCRIVEKTSSLKPIEKMYGINSKRIIEYLDRFKNS